MQLTLGPAPGVAVAVLLVPAGLLAVQAPAVLITAELVAAGCFSPIAV